MREAVQKATATMRELYSEDQLQDLLLEEIELSRREIDPMWLVTMGFTRPRKFKPLDAIVQPQTADRVYKRIKIDANTGAFKGMSDRQLDLADGRS